MLILLRALLVVILFTTVAYSTPGFAANDEAAASGGGMLLGDPRPEARMAIPELERRMAAGDLSAQAELGARYGLGSEVKQDLPKAIGLLRAAADKGNADAQFFLASAYAAGQGVPQSDIQAFMLYEQAANQGHPGGSYMMANMIIYGRAGISPSWSGGMSHLWTAAAKGYPPAMLLLGAAYEDGNAGVVNPRAAAYWYRRYLNFIQDPRAIFNLRRMIVQGVVPYEPGDPGDPPDAPQTPDTVQKVKDASKP